MSADIAAVNIDKLREEIKALRNEIARLNNQTNWVCKCGGTDTEGQRENEEQARLLGQGAEREARLLGRIGELQGILDAVRAANERAAKRWQAAHPGKELVIPDQATMVEWLLDELAKFDDPHRLHAHCVRHLTDLQVSHLFGERMTAVANDRDKLEAENADLREQIEAWKCKYYDVADAICRESSGPEDLCRQARELRADSGRIDWIESHWSGSWLREGAVGEDGLWHIWPGDWTKKVCSGKTIRAAIDAAMKEAKP